MTKTIWTGACGAIVVGAAVAAMAQTPSTQQGASAAAEQKITVTGCLRAAPPAAGAAATAGAAGTATPGAAGTSGAAGATTATDSADAKFVLADAVSAPVAADAGSAATTTGAAAGAASSTTATPQTYQLIANATALQPHVGKKLELTGTVVNQSASSPTAATTATASGPALQVESGKVIAASCQE